MNHHCGDSKCQINFIGMLKLGINISILTSLIYMSGIVSRIMKMISWGGIYFVDAFMI
jgi:hypothetical protein